MSLNSHHPSELHASSSSWEALQLLRDQHLPELSEAAYVDYMGACPDAGEAFWQASRHINNNTTITSATTSGKNTNTGSSSKRSVLLGNPHSPHGLGLNSQQSMDRLRRQVLAALGASHEYMVVFTSGTTAGCRLVAECLGSSGGMSFYPHILSHNSVLGMRGPLLQTTTTNSHNNANSASSYGTFRSVADLTRLQSSRSSTNSTTTPTTTSLVAFPFECNFSGELVFKAMLLGEGTEEEEDTSTNNNNTLADAVKRIKESIRSGEGQEEPLVLVDGAAGMGKHPILLDGSGIDYFVFSFYKWIGAPTGLGALLIRRSSVGGGNSGSSPLKRLLDGKRYSGGGSVEYQLPHINIRSRSDNNGTNHGNIGGVLLDQATLLKGHRHTDTVDPATVVQALEDGTPHFQGIYQASKILDNLIVPNHSMTVPTSWFLLFDPKHVEARISSQRSMFLRTAYHALMKKPQSLSTTAGNWNSQFYPLHEEDRNTILHPNTSSSSSSPYSASHMGSSIAFVVVTSPSSPSSSLSTPHFPFQCVSHALVERLMVHHQHQVCLRAGSFCNPGATLEFLSLSQQEMEEQLIEAGVVVADDNESGDNNNPQQTNSKTTDEVEGIVSSTAAICSKKAVCWDDFSLTSDGRPLGCLRVSFGLLSTPRDVELAVEALASVCTEFSTGELQVDELNAKGSTKSRNVETVATTENVDTSLGTNNITTSPYLVIHSIYVYPVKGCQGFVLDTPGAGWPLGTALQGGMVYDRHWCIVRSSPSSPAVSTSSASPHTSPIPPPTLTVLTPKQNGFLSRIKTSFIRIGTSTTTLSSRDSGLDTELATAIRSQLGDDNNDGEREWRVLAPHLSNYQQQHSGVNGEEGLLFLILQCPKQQVAIAVPANMTIDTSNQIRSDALTSSLVMTFVRGKQVDSIIGTDSFSELVNNELSSELEEPVHLTTSGGITNGLGNGTGNDNNSSKSGGTTTTKGNFSNSGGLLVVHKSSHDVVMEHIRRSSTQDTSTTTINQQQHISLLSYRPNIVLEDESVGGDNDSSNGCSVNYHHNSLPFPELQYDSLAFDSSSMLPSKRMASSVVPTTTTFETVLVSGAPCHRCTQVGVDTTTGQIKSQPLSAIAAISRQYLPTLSEGFRRDVLRVTGQYAILFGQVFQIQQQQQQDSSVDQPRLPRVLCIGQRVNPTLRMEQTLENII